MRLTIIMALILLCLTASLDAQPSKLYVPDNNAATGSSNGWPFTTNGNAGPNWRYQWIINAKQLASPAITITDIDFTATAPAVFQADQLQMRMANTTYSVLTLTTCFDNVLGPNPTTVFNGPVTFPLQANTWCPFGLKNSFLYDGQSNLVIEIRYRSSLTTMRIYTRQGPFVRSWTNGWNSNPDPYNATCPEGAQPGGPKVCLSYHKVLITASGAPNPGGTVDLDLLAVPDASKPYQVASSLGTGPLALGARSLGLSLDDLLVITVRGLLPSVFLNYAGKLDPTGKARASLKIPNDTRLKGIRVHSAFVTLDPAAPLGISLISGTASFTIL